MWSSSTAPREESSPESGLVPQGQRVTDPLRALAEAAVAREPQAVEALFQQLGGTMLRTIRKVLGAGDPDLDDVLQESMLAVLSGLEGFRGDSTVKYFANRVALLVALGVRRRRNSRDWRST